MKPFASSRIVNFSKWTALSVLCGCLSGLAATVFLYALQWATETRESSPWIIWLLPCAGLLIGWAYHHYGQNVAAGTHLILDEIHDPQKIIPMRMAPMILLSTVLTHLAGGSAGREGTAVQMGASLSDQLARFFKIQSHERKILLMAGLGGGFGAAIGTPLAGALFGLEVIHAGRIRFFAAYECLISSLIAFAVARGLEAPHSQFPKIEFVNFDLKTICCVLVAGILFGLAAQLFVRFTHLIEKVFDRFISYSVFRPVVGGGLLILFYKLEGSYRFVGLGIPEIQNAFYQSNFFSDPFLKIFFTALTVGSGFKGGEFIPLVFIGATLGSALSSLAAVPPSLLAAVGFASVFAGAAKTPLACAIMAAELFGWPITIYALAGCYLSFFFCGSHRIYKNSRTKAQG